MQDNVLFIKSAFADKLIQNNVKNILTGLHFLAFNK